jgi:hypothetical protein
VLQVDDETIPSPILQRDPIDDSQVGPYYRIPNPVAPRARINKPHTSITRGPPLWKDSSCKRNGRGSAPTKPSAAQLARHARWPVADGFVGEELYFSPGTTKIPALPLKGRPRKRPVKRPVSLPMSCVGLELRGGSLPPPTISRDVSPSESSLAVTDAPIAGVPAIERRRDSHHSVPDTQHPVISSIHASTTARSPKRDEAIVTAQFVFCHSTTEIGYRITTRVRH